MHKTTEIESVVAFNLHYNYFNPNELKIQYFLLNCIYYRRYFKRIVLILNTDIPLECVAFHSMVS